MRLKEQWIFAGHQQCLLGSQVRDRLRTRETRNMATVGINGDPNNILV
jgi:hypothetical protein